jgi:hypothetical protein
VGPAKLLVIEVPALTPALATRSDLTPHLSDLIAFGAFAVVAPGAGPIEPALGGRTAIRIERVTGLEDASPGPALERQMRAVDARIGELAGAARAAGTRVVVVSPAGVLVTNFETKLPDPIPGAKLVELISSWA